MQCGNYVKFATRRRKGSGEEYQKATNVRSRAHFEYQHDEMITQGFVICDGKVLCTKVEAVDTPDWGCSYAELRVEFKCSKCETTFFPELGDEGTDITKLVNLALDSIKPETRDIMRKMWWEQQLEYRARTDKLVADYKKGKS